MVTSANDNATYHLSELDGMRIAVPFMGKWIKAFKKREEVEPDPEVEVEDKAPSLGFGSVLLLHLIIVPLELLLWSFTLFHLGFSV